MRKLKRGKKATNKMPTVYDSLEKIRRVSSRRCARSPEGERAHCLERTSRLQQEACMQLRCKPKATNNMPSTNNSLEIIQASEL